MDVEAEAEAPPQEGVVEVDRAEEIADVAKDEDLNEEEEEETQEIAYDDVADFQDSEEDDNRKAKRPTSTRTRSTRRTISKRRTRVSRRSRRMRARQSKRLVWTIIQRRPPKPRWKERKRN